MKTTRTERFCAYWNLGSRLESSQQAKNIGPTLALNGYLYESYMGNP